ncbi:MAG TPA: signal peptide peptidase SppA [Vicinamibacteria bacterium]|nr:signal peptide peptidase SppA [Vicinamibacteria bacterium]
MKKRTAWVLVAGVAAVAVGAAAVGGLALLLRGQDGGGGLTGKDQYLAFDLRGEIPEPPSSDLTPFFGRRPPTLRTLVESLDRAAGDAKVKAVVLRVSFLPDAGWGKVQELRDAIVRFRKSGKPAYAHLEFCGNREYYLATACDKIYAVPTGLLDVTGLSAETTFLRGSLDKLGVEAQFEGVGKYKNAPNQYTEKGFTEPHREQMEALLDSVYEQYVTALAKARGKSREQAEAILDQGPFDAKEALKAGLVDELVYRDQLQERLKSGEGVSPARYVKKARGLGLDGRPKLALVFAVGEIVPGESQESPFGGSFAGSETVAHALKSAREDDDYKAVLLRVDSPGGSGTASDVIWREVQLTRKQKPVVISMGDVAASGGYYIAMGGDAIVAQPGTITGSIGVFSGKFSLRGLYDKLGVSKEILIRGRHAALFSEYRPWTQEERDRIRSLMESFYQDFVAKAAEGRKKPVAEIDQMAQGRVWTGAEAFRLGLVDRLGGLEVAVSVAKERAKIGKDQDVQLVILPEKKGFLETLLERQDEGLEASLPADLRFALRWSSLLGDGKPLARLPFDLQIR